MKPEVLKAAHKAVTQARAEVPWNKYGHPALPDDDHVDIVAALMRCQITLEQMALDRGWILERCPKPEE